MAYGTAYLKARRALHLEDNPPCYWCGNPATTADHYPPLAHYPHPPTHPTLVPACTPCNASHRATQAIALQRQRQDANVRIARTTAYLQRQRWHPSMGRQTEGEGTATG